MRKSSRRNMSVKRRTNKKRAKSKRKKTQKSTNAFSSINRRTTGGRKNVQSRMVQILCENSIDN